MKALKKTVGVFFRVLIVEVEIEGRAAEGEFLG